MSGPDLGPIGRAALQACVADVLAPKAGNVHLQAAFDDVAWTDFVVSADVVAPVLDRAVEQGVGATVLECVRRTIEATGTNTNLGIVLLLAPLCAVPAEKALTASAVAAVLRDLTPTDAEQVYDAIRLASPGGLGEVGKADVRAAPTVGLVDAMRLAADRDAVARQYATDFADVFGYIVPRLMAWCDAGERLDTAIVGVHLEAIAREPESLIRRRCGDVVANEAMARAVNVLAAGWPSMPEAGAQFADFDRWLRDDGHRRSPGTAADLVTAGLFVGLREARIEMPADWRTPLDVATMHEP